ncbi:MAG: M28 family peptidase [Phycisphaerae bacterium]|nr:M28 family peptidase [Gemmatimonadaceae bacterium]
MPISLRRVWRSLFLASCAPLALTFGAVPNTNAQVTTGAGVAAAQHGTFAPVTDADTRKLMARLSALSADSMEGRLAGSPGGARARGWLIRELQAMGVKPLAASYEQPVKLRVRAGAAEAGLDTMGANVVGFIAGKNSALPAIVLSAHYDHLGTRNGEVFNGADDDASGCIAVLTIAERVKKAGLEHDLILAFFDAEESGLRGAQAFVTTPLVPLNRMAIDVNLDMVGRQDGGALWVAGLSHNPFLRPVVQPLVAGSKVKILFGHDTKGDKPDYDWTGSSDHGAFHSKGIPFLYLGVEDHADYHKAGDEAGKIDPAFYRSVVDFAEQLVRAVDRAVPRFPVRK